VSFVLRLRKDGGETGLESLCHHPPRLIVLCGNRRDLAEEAGWIDRLGDGKALEGGLERCLDDQRGVGDRRRRLDSASWY